tara:strand:+ start:2677 stop:3456 length:780 start_codon:yes stop_codon:yes gene_type:complete
MKVKYYHGGPVDPEELRKRRVIASLNESQPVSDDPIMNMMRANQLAADRAGMMEGKVQVGDDYVELPYPTSFTGQATPDRSYILDAAMLMGGLPRSVSAGASLADDVALRQLRTKQATDRVQNVADRAIREGAREESQAIVNLQGQFEEAVRAAAQGEKDKVDAILMKMTSDAAARRAAEDEIYALAETLSGRSGGLSDKAAMNPLMKDYLGMGDISMTEYLANPENFRRTAGYPRLPFNITRGASRNEFGGQINVKKR